MSGREYPRWANHFDPYSPIYSRRERSEILISDCALGLMCSGLFSLAKTFGWLWLTKVDYYLTANSKQCKPLSFHLLQQASLQHSDCSQACSSDDPLPGRCRIYWLEP